MSGPRRVLPTVRLDALADQTDKLIARLSGAMDEPAVKARLRDRLAAVPDSAALVVVGETKKGKSSVLNALLGRPGVSPVEPDVATATYVWFEHGADEAAIVQTGTGTEHRVRLDDLSRWVTVSGLEENREARDADGAVVAHPVRVTLDAPLLKELALIDTPGVGGLVGAHTAMTLRAIGLTGAMLFVTDLTAPMTQHECEFLQRVADGHQLAEVVIAASMSDKLLPDQRVAALAAVRDVLERRLPAFADAVLVPVSATQAETASRPDLHDEARRILREQSGLDELERVLLERVARRTQVLSHGMRLQIVQSAAHQLARDAQAELDLLGDTDPASRAAAIQDRILDLSHEMEIARMRLTDDLSRLRQTLSMRTDSASREWLAEVERRIAAGASSDDLGPWLTAQVAAFAQELTDQTAAGIRAAYVSNIASVVADDDEAARDLDVALEVAVARTASEMVLRGGLAPTATPMSADALLMSSMAFIGAKAMGATAVAGGGAVAGWLTGVTGIVMAGPFVTALPVMLPVAFGAGVVSMSYRRQKNALRVNDARTWARERVSVAARDLGDAVAIRVNEATTLAAIAIREYTKEQADRSRAAQRAVKSDDVALAASKAKGVLSAATACEESAVKLLQDVAVRPALPAS